MTEEILINYTPQETRVAIIENGIVQELHVERQSSSSLVGNVYRGTVCRVLPGMQSAFVDIGLQRAAFLHVADVVDCNEGETQKNIQDVLREGQSLIVQVIKEPIGSKGARLTTQISIAGRFLVYLPQQDHIGVSQRIADEAEREKLRDRLVKLLPENHKGGYIIRTMAEDATDDDLKSDVAYLHKVEENIQSASKSAATRTLVFQDLNLCMRVLRDVASTDTKRILVDSRENFQQLLAFATSYTTTNASLLEHYQGERPLFDTYNVEAEIAKAMSRKVELKSGGYLIIDQTEALTTVDVNTGGFVSGINLADTIFRTNIEACKCIARQLRLRNLGGIIIIDFIDMDDDEQRAAVLAELNLAVASDRTRISVSGFSALGLVEMTRKRTRESLSHILCEACSYCKGSGALKTAQTVCYEILREILRQAREFDAKELRVHAAKKVIDLLQSTESQSLANLAEFIGKPISLQIEDQYGQDAFNIILVENRQKAVM
ncbi:ribonuclease G [Methyloradius palustris]|uniref:Ribonuclease G n=1 Tax=Methyloradius palustris TaxID=2778876 RepID=A0A8D5GE38_9PROT|nr:ribonuclease G [Methyloradius palustris]BCM25743.1 ribonuclease G [Methyloradius palustris]